MIIDDETTTLQQHMRRITFQDGPLINVRHSRGAIQMQVTHLALKWFDGQEPGPVVAHGVYFHENKGIVHAERSYDLDGKKCPRWVKEAVHGTDA